MIAKQVLFRFRARENAAKVVTLIHSCGGVRSKVWAATEWERFKLILRGTPHAA